MTEQSLEFGEVPIGSYLIYHRTNIIIGRLTGYNWGNNYSDVEVQSINNWYIQHNIPRRVTKEDKRLHSINVIKIYNYTAGTTFKKPKERSEHIYAWSPITDKRLDHLVEIIKNQAEMIKIIRDDHKVLEKGIKV